MNDAMKVPQEKMPIGDYVPYRRYTQAQVVGAMTAGEFVAWERTTPEKHQYIEGNVVRMPGSSPEHNLIQADLQFEVTLALRTSHSPCDVIGSDQKVFVSDDRLLYPDLTIFCGEAQFDHLNALRNPTVIVEILSPTTEKDDRTDKFDDYQRIASLQSYILVEQNRAYVTHYRKQPNGLWAIFETVKGMAGAITIPFEGGSVSVPLAAVYRRVPPPEMGISEAGGV